MSDHHHDCPGLFECENHPRWNVTLRQRGAWEATPPGRYHFPNVRLFPSHTQAFNHAQKQARKATR